MSKIYDCITFFDDNFLANLRFEILYKSVDYFVICESKFDHKNRKKKLNFKLVNKKFKKKLIYLILDYPFKKKTNPWQNQAYQRDYMLRKLDNIDQNDYVMFSDPDEIPNPKVLENFKLKKKYGIFMQKMYCYKFNLFNQFESPWEGTRVCKKKDLFSIDYMRQKILKKNLQRPFWKFYKEKNIEIFENAGWHFNSLLSPKQISKKLKAFAHVEFSKKEYSDVKIIKSHIKKRRDLFGRNITYRKVILNKSFPKYILDNKKKFKEWIL